MRSTTIVVRWSTAAFVVLVAGACGPPAAPANAPGGLAVDPADKAYCDAVAAPTPDQAAVAAASEADRRRIDAIASLAPPEIAADWRTLRAATDEAAGAVTAAGDDPNRVDRAALARLGQETEPAVERIRAVTQQRCGVAFRPPA